MLLLQMFDLACVTIPYEHVSLRKSLLTFWQDFSETPRRERPPIRGRAPYCLRRRRAWQQRERRYRRGRSRRRRRRRGPARSRVRKRQPPPRRRTFQGRRKQTIRRPRPGR